MAFQLDMNTGGHKENKCRKTEDMVTRHGAKEIGVWTLS